MKNEVNVTKCYKYILKRSAIVICYPLFKKIKKEREKNNYVLTKDKWIIFPTDNSNCLLHNNTVWDIFFVLQLSRGEKKNI